MHDQSEQGLWVAELTYLHLILEKLNVKFGFSSNNYSDFLGERRLAAAFEDQ